LTANERRGADLVIYKTNGNQIQGELIAVKQNSLLLKEHDSGADVTAVISEIKTITIVKKSKALMFGGTGLFIGGVCGALFASAAIGETEDITAEGWAAIFGISFGISAATLGGIIGGIMGIDKTIQIEGKSDSEVKQTLAELRKKARVPDFQ
jgi:hypothetical protein